MTGIRKYFLASFFVAVLVAGALALWPFFSFRSVQTEAGGRESVSNGRTVHSRPAENDDDLDRYDKPGYFSIFRFIGNFIP